MALNGPPAMSAFRLLSEGFCCKSRKLHRTKFLAKSQKREAIADSYVLSRLTELAYDFNAR
jgi:hypothetical protein